MFIGKENNSVFLIQKLNNIKQKLNSDPIDLSALKKEFESFMQLKQKENYSYLEDLLDPINRKGVTLPSKIPTATCSFQLHNEFPFNLNTRGYYAILINPFFLTSIKAGDIIPYKNGDSPRPEKITELEFVRPPNQVWKVGDSYYGGAAENDPYVDACDGMQFSIPPIYTSYRVVSACAQLSYTGNVTEAQGIVGGEINLQKFQGLSATIFYVFESGDKIPLTSEAPAGISSVFPLKRMGQSIYSIENNVLEGVKMLYFPLDNSFTEFKPVMTANNVQCKRGYRRVGTGRPLITGPEQDGFNWIFYVAQGKPNDQNSYKIEYWINYECIPDSKFLNYIPIAINAWKIPKWAISELAKTMEKYAVTTIKKMSGIDFLIA